MKKFSVLLLLLLSSGYCLIAQKYEFKQVTTIESVIAGGLGRSRMITTDPKGNTDEVKMKNFFSLTGINFGNIRKNDKLVSEKISELGDQGWELTHTSTGVYSGGTAGATIGGTGGAASGVGIFITRYLFRREKK